MKVGSEKLKNEKSPNLKKKDKKIHQNFSFLDVDY